MKMIIDYSSLQFQVAFSDESTFCCINEGHQRVYRKSSESPHRPEMLSKLIKHPPKVMIWGIISAHGPGRLHLVEGMMNGVQYNHVIRTRVIPQVTEWYGTTEDSIFMQDKAPCHTAKVNTKALADHGINVLDWPGNSPDLNPIENIWGYMKRAIASDPPTNRKDLTAKLLKVWFHDPKIKAMCISVVASMPQRLEKVITAKGGHINY